MAFHQLLVTVGAVLDSPVRVDDEARLDIPSLKCHLQCVSNQLFGHAGIQRPADDTARIQVHYRGQIQPAIPDPDIGDIRRPLLVRTFSIELTLEEIIGDAGHRFGVRRILESLTITRPDAVMFQDIGDIVKEQSTPRTLSSLAILGAP